MLTPSSLKLRTRHRLYKEKISSSLEQPPQPTLTDRMFTIPILLERSIGFNAVLETVQLPAGIADLHA